MLVGETPHDGVTASDIQKNIVNHEINTGHFNFKRLSAQAQDFVKRCCTKIVKNRPSAEDLLRH